MVANPVQQNIEETYNLLDINLYCKFKENNPHCEIIFEQESIIIEKPWGSDDTRLVFYDLSTEIIENLNKIVFNPQFDAIIHIDLNAIEFIFGFLSPNNEPDKSFIDRKFTVHFDGIKLDCKFEEPTSELLFIARAIRRKPSDSGITVPQLKAFRDFQRLDRLPENISKYFENKEPRSFFIYPDTNISEIDLESICRHINLIANYYDRVSPDIIIRNKDTGTQDRGPKPNRFIESNFPGILAINSIDDVTLRLLEVSKRTTPRYAFLYLYQVIEYTAFYYIDDNAKKSLRNFLRDPSMINCDDGKINQLMSILINLQCNDDVKMKRIIESYCRADILWKEIENDKDFFSNKVSFDGGFELSALISKDTTPDSWKAMWMPKLFDHLTKIRNCLVHARERRQDKVILPTNYNSKNINRYLPLIRRLSEQLAICSISTAVYSTNICGPQDYV